MLEYANLQAALLTKHGKEAVIVEVMLEGLGLEVIHVNSYDTDLFGTFTRDIERQGNQYDAALAKALKGMEIADTQIGLSSEGLFTLDPFSGFFPWNNELVLFVDQSSDVKVTGFSSSQAQAYSASISIDDDIEPHLKKALFPSHHLVVRADGPESTTLVKGINTREALNDTLKYFFTKSKTGKAFIENDLRAFANPTRMMNIKNATINLVERLKSHCPSCDAPGFWVANRIPGLCCGSCGLATRETLAEVFECKKCKHQEEVKVKNKFADQSKCDFCNP
jgi:ribosomal protein S27AE